MGLIDAIRSSTFPNLEAVGRQQQPASQADLKTAGTLQEEQNGRASPGSVMLTSAARPTQRLTRSHGERRDHNPIRRHALPKPVQARAVTEVAGPESRSGSPARAEVLDPGDWLVCR